MIKYCERDACGAKSFNERDCNRHEPVNEIGVRQTHTVNKQELFHGSHPVFMFYL